ncbi:unnamed protein product [Urochloa decumbens]|uniref:Uncharacterized protein n=1 Tax=Urochloa decumbens TaxID=240449 RepID=A0ABC9AZ14_9POAL
MARIMHYLMATSFIVFAMISFNSSSCQACIGRWCFTPEPCFQPTSPASCTDDGCRPVCSAHLYTTNNAYCKKGRRESLCCCPPPS